MLKKRSAPAVFYPILLAGAVFLLFSCERVTVDERQLELEDPYIPDLGLKKEKAETPKPEKPKEQIPTTPALPFIKDPETARFFAGVREDIRSRRFAGAEKELLDYLGKNEGKPAAEHALLFLVIARAGLKKKAAMIEAVRELETRYPNSIYISEMRKLLATLKARGRKPPAGPKRESVREPRRNGPRPAP